MHHFSPNSPPIFKNPYLMASLILNCYPFYLLELVVRFRSLYGERTSMASSSVRVPFSFYRLAVILITFTSASSRWRMGEMDGSFFI